MLRQHCVPISKHFVCLTLPPSQYSRQSSQSCGFIGRMMVCIHVRLPEIQSAGCSMEGIHPTIIGHLKHWPLEMVRSHAIYRNNFHSNAMSRFGIPYHFCSVVRNMVRGGGATSRQRPQCPGIPQGCPLSPFLSSIVMTMLIHDAKAAFKKGLSQCRKNQRIDICWCNTHYRAMWCFLML